MLPVAVLAGGLGTRIRHLTGPDTPKALVSVAGRPFIEHKLAELRQAGIERAVFLVGHGSALLRDTVGDGSRFGLDVDYREDGPELLGTGGAVRRALDLLGDPFFVTYGDTLLQVPVEAVQAAVCEEGILGAMTVLENADRWEPSNTDLDDGVVVAYEKPARLGVHRFLDYGFLAFRAAAFNATPPEGAFDLTDVVGRLIKQRALRAVVVGDRFHDIGTEAALRETEQWITERERM